MGKKFVITGNPRNYRLTERVFNTYDGPDYTTVSRLTDDEAGALVASRVIHHLYSETVDRGNMQPSELLSIEQDGRSAAIMLRLGEGKAGRMKGLQTAIPGWDDILVKADGLSLIRLSARTGIPLHATAYASANVAAG